ncbi:MAG: hypothetical protein Q8M02_09860 [Candidatus Didemnitutus sp.]|nr:hypothetical protein [Candidatus Didemnitutus sp.]
MLLFAASALETAQTVPAATWLKLGIVIASLVALVFILRKIAGMNKILVGVAVGVVLSVIFFSWVYKRNEPSWMTPIVDKVAPFFPKANAFEKRRNNAP